jgi:hypothetical protein
MISARLSPAPVFIPSLKALIYLDTIANKLKPSLPTLSCRIAPARLDIPSRYFYEYSNDKARDILGITFKTKEETTRDTIEVWANQGI